MSYDIIEIDRAMFQKSNKHPSKGTKWYCNYRIILLCYFVFLFFVF